MSLIDKIVKENGVMIIAELGVNYYDIAKRDKISIMEAAKLMIDQAQENGADAVKFQSYKAESIASKNSPAYWDLKEEPTTSQYELFKKFDKFGKEEYKELSDYCKSRKILFLSTPFDFEAVDYLYDLVPAFKISSSDLTNIPFIKYIASKQKPILLSTGAATLGEIDEAIKEIVKMENNHIYIMHCILDYPTKYEDINLNMIKMLKHVYPHFPIGFSDHSKPDESMMIPTIAYVYGAIILEKHFTLDKNLPGNDHYHAMDPKDLKKLRSNIILIKKISGQFHKEPLPCEKEARKNARRSIVAKINIPKGEKITSEKITFKRPGTGIPPSMIDYVVGGIALKDIKEDEILTFDKVKLIHNL